MAKKGELIPLMTVNELTKDQLESLDLSQHKNEIFCTTDENEVGGTGGTGEAGFSPTIDVSKSGSTTTLTITDVNGTKTATINDGAKGDKGDTGSNGVSATHSWNGTTLTITSASGTSSSNLKGEKGEQGIQGTKGDKGDTGIGVSSITQTTTSSVDGGDNIITITKTDGTSSTFKVKNGTKGSTGDKGDKGDTGANGEDGKSAYKYAQEGGFKGTEDEFKEKLATQYPTTLPNPKGLIINGIVYDGSETVEMQLDDVEIVESVEQMTDTKKYYAIKNDEGNGDIWWYVYRKGHTNWLPIAYTSPSNHTPLGGIGYKVNWKVNGSTGAEEVPPDGLAYLTGYIPIVAGSVVTCKNIKMDTATYGCIAVFYDANGVILAGKHIGYDTDYIVDNEYNGITITVPPNYTTAKYIRIQGYYEYKKTPELNTAVIVVDEPISDYETGWHWEDSGVDTSLGNDTALLELTKRVTALEEGGITTPVTNDLPNYWSEHLDEKIAIINEHIENGGRNAFAYVVMADLHISEQKALYTGKLARRIMDECKIKNALDLGDHTSRGYIEDRETSDGQFDDCRNLIEPIAENILPTQGNHDGTMVKSNGTTEYYTPREAIDQVYGGMRTDMPIVWDKYGTGYYADDRSYRVRYIVLNTSSRGNFTGDLASNGGYTYFRYTQSQYDLVKDALSTLPNDRWRVVVTSHVPPVGQVDRFGDGLSVSNLTSRFPDAYEMRKLLTAYVNRTTVSINYTDASVSYGNASLTADFTDAKGKLIAYHTGHMHVDLLWNIGDVCDSNINDTLAFPIICHRCDSFNENQGSTSSIEMALESERVAGTITEHSFDVVIVDTDNKVMNIVKIGAGQDRIVYLDGSTGGGSAGGNYADPASTDWEQDSRLSSSGVISSSTGAIVSNYIPVTNALPVYVKGLRLDKPLTDGGKVCRSALYDSDKTLLGVLDTSERNKDLLTVTGTGADMITKIDISSKGSNIAYIRVGGQKTVTSDSDIIITVNQEIV